MQEIRDSTNLRTGPTTLQLTTTFRPCGSGHQTTHVTNISEPQVKPNKIHDLQAFSVPLKEQAPHPKSRHPRPPLEGHANRPSPIDLPLQPTPDCQNEGGNLAGDPALHHIMAMFEMPEGRYASGIRRFNVWLHQCTGQTRVEVKQLLLHVHLSFHQLQKISPSFGSELARCQACLQQFLLVMEVGGLHVRSVIMTTALHSEYNSPESQEHSIMSPSSSSRSSCTNFSPQNSSGSRSATSSLSGGVDLNQHELTRTPFAFSRWTPEYLLENLGYEELISDPFDFGTSVIFDAVLCSPPENDDLNTSAVRMALQGWIYYGQIFATSFTIYAYVYIRLEQLQHTEPIPGINSGYRKTPV